MAEHLAGQVPPGDPGPVTVCDALDHGAVITGRVIDLASIRRQQRLDPLPLLVRRDLEPTHARESASSLAFELGDTR